jgi:hypothetical protein
MNRFFKLNQKNNNTYFFFIVFLFAFFSNTPVFSQNESFEVSTEEVLSNQKNIVIENPVKVSSSVINSNVNFILWFMGTKEDMNNTFSDDGLSTKKSILTSGREPNHLLMKTLLKKALNIKSC